MILIVDDDRSVTASLVGLLLVISFVVLLGIGALRRWATRHDGA